MATNLTLEQLLSELRTPQAGRKLVREILETAPVRKLQHRADTVRTRFISKKMDRAMLAESRTVELAAFVMYEADPTVSLFLAQPCLLDMSVSGLTGGRTRLPHTPDVFVVQNGQLFLDEWRTEERLRGLAEKRPNHFQKDSQAVWHYLPAEEHCAALGITHRLRSADTLPYTLLANVRFLEDYNLESAPLVPEEIAKALVDLVATCKHVPYLELIREHKFSADHIWPMVLDGRLYVDLHKTRCNKVDDLILYASPLIAQADLLLRGKSQRPLVGCELELRPGMRFVYDGKGYTVKLAGAEEVFILDDDGNGTSMPLDLVRQLHKDKALDAGSGEKTEREYDLDKVIANESTLKVALERVAAVGRPDTSSVPARTLRRWLAKVAGTEDPQQQLQALLPQRGGNTTKRLPARVIELALECMNKGPNRHNRAANPTVASTYTNFIAKCDEEGLKPMGRTTFYAWVEQFEKVRDREGRRAEYQLAPIPLVYDEDQPVHGVLPHEVVYCDHTVINMFTKGMQLENLGKATLTLMNDGVTREMRAFVLMYRPPGTASVLMCLRDYVKRWGRLPRILVLDNGKEFHSNTIKAFCSLFGIDIRWRRRSKPRDSTLIERAIGMTEQELFSALDGNTRALKNPRNVSSEVKPDKFIEWTLPALHGSLENFLFDVHAKRIHPALGMSPHEYGNKLLIEFGARRHRYVRFDEQFKLLTSPHPKASPVRILDRRKGVFVDGIHYWNDKFASSTKKEEKVAVRVELWNASVVYVLFRGNWLVAQARDGRRLEGRFNYEVEMLQRDESRLKRTAAAKDRQTPEYAHKKARLLDPALWDPRLREQCMEEYLLYKKLGMVEALPTAENSHGLVYDLGLRRSSDIELLESLEKEGDWSSSDAGQGDEVSVDVLTAETASMPGEPRREVACNGPRVETPVEKEAVTDDDFL